MNCRKIIEKSSLHSNPFPLERGEPMPRAASPRASALSSERDAIPALPGALPERALAASAAPELPVLPEDVLVVAAAGELSVWKRVLLLAGLRVLALAELWAAESVWLQDAAGAGLPAW
jgi:hypothetical protein